MITVENAIGRPTCATDVKTRSPIDPSPFDPRWRKTFSTTMTVESMMIPKSTAPSEIRFAGVPVRIIPMNATSSASGMLSAVIADPRRFPRKKKRTTETRTIPRRRFSRTVCVVVFTSVPRS